LRNAIDDLWKGTNLLVDLDHPFLMPISFRIVVSDFATILVKGG